MLSRWSIFQMQSMGKANSLIVILGPTAVGKTEISLELATRFGGEIVSADSRLFYRGMDIGTAKPSRDELMRVPHHLIDVADLDEVWSLAKFQRAAYAAIEAIHQRGRLPFLVGGTGQYVRAVIEGWEVPEVKPDLQLRDALQSWGEQVGAEGLHERLRMIDPQAAARMDPSNMRRSVRALEVIYHTGRRFSEQQRKSGAPYRTLLIGLTRPRPELYARIDARVEKMVEDGLVEEVRGLLAMGYREDLSPLSAIGYREVIAHLRGEITMEEGMQSIKRATRQYVRRQANWFKSDDPEIQWFQAGDQPIQEMSRWIEKFLES